MHARTNRIVTVIPLFVLCQQNGKWRKWCHKSFCWLVKRELSSLIADPKPKVGRYFCLDKICFFSCLFCFSFVLTICTHFAFQCTHFAFYRTHFASYFSLKFQHYYVIKLTKIHQTKKTMNVKHTDYQVVEEKQ